MNSSEEYFDERKTVIIIKLGEDGEEGIEGM